MNPLRISTTFCLKLVAKMSSYFGRTKRKNTYTVEKLLKRTKDVFFDFVRLGIIKFCYIICFAQLLYIFWPQWNAPMKKVANKGLSVKVIR